LAGTYSYTSLDEKKYDAGYGYAINDSNQVAGSHHSKNSQVGFVWSNGTFQQVPDGKIVNLTAINDSGLAAGQFVTKGNIYVGLTFNSATSQTTTLNLGIKSKDSVTVSAINAGGTVAGSFYTKKFVYTGFTVNGSTVTQLSYPHAKETRAFGLNDSGTVVGLYFSGAVGDTVYGFSYSGGSYTPLASPSCTEATFPLFITNGGLIGGECEASGASVGFTLSGSTYSFYTYPGAVFTQLLGAGPGGELIGDWNSGGESPWQGFIYLGGTYYPINVPGATTTLISAINASGSLTGTYTDSANAQHAFIATCPAAQMPCTQ